MQLDKWGEPLPLSAAEQARIDRLVAVAADPLERTWALVLSGTLDPLEAECCAVTSAGAYNALVSKAKMDMAMTPPPYAPWAEQTLGILFGKPAAKVYVEAQIQPASAGKPSARNDEASFPTPSDRREIPVRQKGM